MCTDADALPTVYALIWRSHATDDAFNPDDFQERIPALMDWLRALQAEGRLVACGGGGFENHSGGLTLTRAEDPGDALNVAAAHPMNDIGDTELLVWDVYYGELDVPRAWSA